MLWTSLLFGAWHVLTTVEHDEGNAVSEVIANRGRGQWLAVLATGLSIAGSGAVVALLRLCLRSVLAPVLAHAAVNITSDVAARRATKADGLTHGGR